MTVKREQSRNGGAGIQIPVALKKLQSSMFAILEAASIGDILMFKHLTKNMSIVVVSVLLSRKTMRHTQS